MKLLWMAMFLMVGGCAKSHFLDQRTVPDRAKYGTAVIDVTTQPARPVNPDPIVPGSAGQLVPEVTGTWNFTVPPTVTRVEHRTGAMDEFTLFIGRPAPTDVPFMVITTSHDRQSRAEHDAAFKVQDQREYTMNGNIVHEWTGLTATGAGFCELLIRKPGTPGETGDVCHAVALARTEDEQTLALPILESIVWTPVR